MADRMILSVVVPAFNEAGNIDSLYERVSRELDALDTDWELILVDDGSTDGTAETIRKLHARDPRVKGLLLSRNFGHEVASTAGLDAARGDAIVLMDADLQDPPSLIPALIAKWREGYDIVSAQRISRRGESYFKKATAFLFYRFMERVVGWHHPRDTGDFRVMSRAALEAFLECRERNRFVRALVAWTGFRQTTVPFERDERHAGETKYDAITLLRLAITSITSFSVIPLRVASWLGALLVSISILFGAFLLIRRLLGEPASIQTLTLLSIWFLGGIQCLTIGILGEYVGRTYVETQHRPLYYVQEALGVDPPAHAQHDPTR